MLVVKTEAEAREAVALYTSGLAFDRIVRERSIGPERERGGYLGRIDMGSLSPMARSAILKTRPGGLTPVFPAEGGFGVCQVLTEREAREEEERLRREPEALEALKRGTELGRRGDLEGAVGLLRRAVELNPALIDGHFNLAIAQARLGRTDDAITTMREVVRRNPQDFDAHIKLGTWLSGQGRYAEAAGHFERAAALDVTSRDAWLGMARSYEAAGRPRPAVAAYRRALGLAGQDDRGLLEALFRVAMAAPDGPAAVEAARSLRTLRSGHEGFLMVGDAFMLNGETEAAVREYRMAVGLAPRSSRAHGSLATALAGLGQTESAAEHLLQAVRLDPRNPEHYRALSALYAQMGRYDLAIVALRDGASQAGEAPRETQADMVERLAALYDRVGMSREAEQERGRAKSLRSR
jgi:tetratricopeptide (TPR) repeat protein